MATNRIELAVRENRYARNRLFSRLVGTFTEHFGLIASNVIGP